LLKIFLFPSDPNHRLIPRHPVPNEGRFAIVTDVGRDAVDAAALLTNSAQADGEVVWFWRPDAGVKSGGFIPARRRWQESRSPGSTKETVKTIAQGRPDCFR
jgi:hypothetical protein